MVNLPNSLAQKLLLIVPCLLQAWAHAGFWAAVHKILQGKLDVLCVYKKKITIVCIELQLHSPGLFPLGLGTGTVLSLPAFSCPRFLTGFTGLCLSVGFGGGGGGTYLAVGAGGWTGGAGRTLAKGLTAGFDGIVLVPAPALTAGIWKPWGTLVYWAKKPSITTLRSDTNWTSRTFPLVSIGLERKIEIYKT